MRYTCARCHRPIEYGEEMIEKLGGEYVTTHRDCEEVRIKDKRKSINAMIRDAFRHGPSADLRKKAREVRR